MYVVDKMAQDAGHTVLRLPPYHCNLNAIEMVWSALKRSTRRQNVFTSDPLEVVNLIKKVCESITADDWKKYTNHVKNVEDNYRKTDHIVDEVIDPLVISVDDETDDEFFDDSCGIEYDSD